MLGKIEIYDVSFKKVIYDFGKIIINVLVNESFKLSNDIDEI